MLNEAAGILALGNLTLPKDTLVKLGAHSLYPGNVTLEIFGVPEKSYGGNQGWAILSHHSFFCWTSGEVDCLTSWISRSPVLGSTTNCQANTPPMKANHQCRQHARIDSVAPPFRRARSACWLSCTSS